MTTALVTEELLERRPPEHVANIVTELFNSREPGQTPTMSRLPSPEERNLLTTRARVVGSLLRPIDMASEEKISAGGAISRMLADCWPNFKPEEPLTFLNGFVDSVKGLPMFAITEAIDDFKHGRVKQVSNGDGKFSKVDPSFPPALPVFVQVAEKKTLELSVERHRLKEVLAITKARIDPSVPRSTDEQAAITAQVSDWRQENNAKKAEEDLAERARRKEESKNARKRSNELILAEYKSLGRTPVYGPGNQLLSPSLLKSIGRESLVAPSQPEQYRREE